MVTARLLAIISLLLLFSACGGGGGGGGGGGDDEETPDTQPDAFSFADQTGVTVSTLVESAAVTISGINRPAQISVAGGEYSIGAGGYTSVAGTIQAGQTVRVRQTSSAQFSTATDATLTVGGVSDVFSVTTEAEDTAPDAFSFTDQINVNVSLLTISSAITINGINTAAPISITGGEYSIDGGAYTAAAGTVQQGQTVTVRQTSSSQVSTTTDATLTVGGVSDTFSVTTRSEIAPPTVAILFPHVDGTVVNSSTITIRGSADDASGVQSIVVNDVAATTSDAYANWEATVSLTPGDPIEVSVEATDTLGNVDPDAAGTTVVYKHGFSNIVCHPHFGVDTVNGLAYIHSVLQGIVEYNLANETRRLIPNTHLLNQGRLEYSSANGRLYQLSVDILYEIGLQNGNRIIVSPEAADGITLANVFDIEIDDTNDVMYVFDGTLSAVVAIDLDDGSREIISDESGSFGTGPDFDQFGTHLAFDDGRLFASTGAFDPAIIEVNLGNGNRTVISDDTLLGTDLAYIQGLIADVSAGVLYAADFSGGFFEVDMDTGVPTLLSPADQVNNLSYEQHFDTQFDRGNNRALISSCQSGVLLAIDLADGERSRALSVDRGAGPNLIGPRRMAYDPARNRVVSLNGIPSALSNYRSIIAVDPITGDRALISGNVGSGSGPAFGDLLGIAMDTVNDRILVTDRQEDAIIAINPVTGARMELSGPGRGAGIAFDEPNGIAVDGNRALVVDFPLDALIAVDLTSGDRTIVSQTGVAGSGPDFDGPTDIAVDVVNRQAYVVSQSLDTLFRVNIDTGVRTIVADAATGTGPALDDPTYITVDLQRNVAIVIMFGGPSFGTGVVLVDLATGNREFMSASGFGRNLLGLTWDPASSRIYTGESSLHAIGVYDIDTNQHALISR